MSEVILAYGAISGLLGAITTYAIARYMTRDDVLFNKLDSMVEKAAHNQEFLQDAYTIGAVIGKGLSDGTGLKAFTKGGKPKWIDIAMAVAQNYIPGLKPKDEQAPGQNPETGISLPWDRKK